MWLLLASPRPAPHPQGVEHSLPSLERHAHDPVGVVEMRLDNGLRVWMAQVPAQPMVFGAIVVDVGSKNDPSGDTGLAHYLEHMLFKGTTQLGTSDYSAEQPWLRQLEHLYEQLRLDPTHRSQYLAQIRNVASIAQQYARPNELDRLLQRMGGTDINAFTHPDYTVYYNAFPPSQIDSWIRVYAHRFTEPVFRGFTTELEAVYEEKNRSMGGFMNTAYEAFMSAFFPDHPYGTQSSLGSIEHLKSPSLRAMKRFYSEHYVANNMALILVGNFDIDRVAPIVEASFSQLARGPSPAPAHGTIAAFKGPERTQVRVTPIRASAVGYRMPPRGHSDDAAIDVLSGLLSNPQRSGAIDQLVDHNRLLAATTLRLEFHDGDGLIILFAPRLLTQTFRGAERSIERIIQDLRERAVAPKRLHAVRDNLLRDAQQEWEDPKQLALRLADLFARGQTWADHLAYLGRLARVSSDDLQRAANTYLGQDRMLLRSRAGRVKAEQLAKPRLPPPASPPTTSSAYYQNASSNLLPADASQTVSFDEDIERWVVRSGLTVQANHNPINDLYRLELRFSHGRLDEPALVPLARLLEIIGTEQDPSSTYKQRWSAISTQLAVTAEDDAFVVTLVGPEAHLEQALQLLDGLMQQPERSSHKLRQLKRETWATEWVLRRQPENLAHALFESVVYGSWAEQRRFGARQGRRYGLRRLFRHWQDVQTFPLTVRYVGRRPIEAIASLVGKTLVLETTRDSTQPQTRPLVTYDQPSVVFVPRRGAVQTHIYAYIRGQTATPDELASRPAFDEYLGGGMGGLLFQEIRELRSLAYATGGGYVEPQLAGHPGFTYAYVACQADKSEETLALLVSLLSQLPRKSKRLSALRDAVAHRQEIEGPSFRTLQTQVEQWRRQGYETDPRPSRLEALDQLSFADIEAFWERHIKRSSPLVLMVVGDPRKISASTLRRWGTVQTLRPRQLYRPN